MYSAEASLKRSGGGRCVCHGDPTSEGSHCDRTLRFRSSDYVLVESVASSTCGKTHSVSLWMRSGVVDCRMHTLSAGDTTHWSTGTVPHAPDYPVVKWRFPLGETNIYDGGWHHVVVHGRFWKRPYVDNRLESLQIGDIAGGTCLQEMICISVSLCHPNGTPPEEDGSGWSGSLDEGVASDHALSDLGVGELYLSGAQ